MNRLDQGDVSHTILKLPKVLRRLIVKYELILAGGFIRASIAGEETQDIDLFGGSYDTLRAAHTSLYDTLEQDDPGRAKGVATLNAFSIYHPTKKPVQFIHRWVFPNAEECIKSFDFTIAQAGIWYDSVDNKWVSVCSDRFYIDLAARRLVYTSPERNEDAGGSMLRLRKFLTRGYNIQINSMAAVIARLTHNIPVETEEATASAIMKRLVEVDPLIDANDL